MIHATRTAVRRWLEILLHAHDSPRRTAAAFALGVFFGFSPFLGLHTVLGVSFAFLLGLNRVAVVLGVYMNLPWIMAEWYALMTAFGAWLLGTGLPRAFAGRLRSLFELSLFQAEFWRRLVEFMRPLLWPYVVGSTLGAVVLAGVAFLAAEGFVEEARRLRRIHHHQADGPKN